MRVGEQDASKADGLALPSQDGDSSVELPRVLLPYVVVLRERKDGASEKQIALKMVSCNVSPQRVVCLLDYASQINTPLIRLCLSKNPLGPEGARLLGNALVTNNTLQFLELDECELVGSSYRPQHEGILTLSKAIQSVRSRLRYVNLASNDLQPEGCRILLGAMSFHKTLTALDISDNMLSLFNDKQGYLALSYLMQYSKQLCWLSIADNPLTPAAATALKQSLWRNHSLTALNVYHCGISKEEWLNYPSHTANNVENNLPSNESKKKQQQKRPDGLLHMLKC
ncbi:hypothetical protein PHMEG_00016342, partial [Phytophthora megakarya]